MKKLSAIILSISILSLVGCGGNQNQRNDNNVGDTMRPNPNYNDRDTMGRDSLGDSVIMPTPVPPMN